MNKQFRQGDVFLVKTSDKPEGTPIKPTNGRFILAEGELTGHNHTITAEKNLMWQVAPEKTMLEVGEKTTLDHQTHAPIEVSPGTYWVVRQRQQLFGETVRVQD